MKKSALPFVIPLAFLVVMTAARKACHAEYTVCKTKYGDVTFGDQGIYFEWGRGLEQQLTFKNGQWHDERISLPGDPSDPNLRDNIHAATMALDEATSRRKLGACAKFPQKAPQERSKQFYIGNKIPGKITVYKPSR